MSKTALADEHGDCVLSLGQRVDLAGKRLHFVGIGGCGMSGLALMASRAGAVCSGTDNTDSDVLDQLRTDGIEVECVQTASSVPANCDLMVVSAAIKPDHPEVAEAKRRGVGLIKYAQLLGRLMIGRTGIAVAGTHGKSTTTSLLCHVLIEAGLDPSFIVGANCRQIGGGSRVGADAGPLVAEACEFDRSFHNFHPAHAVVLNVEEDHLDIYSGIDEIVESFAVFVRKVPHDGSLLIQHESPHRPAITAGLKCPVSTIGQDPAADWRVEVAAPPDGCAAERSVGTTVRLHRAGRAVASWSNPLPGEHMAYNAAVAAVTAHRLGAAWNDIVSAIESFGGLDRRMQLLGTRELAAGAGPLSKPAHITVVDDYGHHPTEIDTTLRALRRHHEPRRMICVFQPHQHSRTRFLLEQFAASFSQANVVIVPHIYFVRDSETERHAVRAADLVDRLRKQGVQAMHLYPFDAIVEQLELMVRDGDLLVTMGAGDVWRVGHDFMKGPASPS